MSASDRESNQKHAFDWDGVRGRIAAVRAALEEIEGADPELVERIWAQRAAQLAKSPAHKEEGGQVELALIQLGREVYGIEVQHILEIRPAVRITRVPRVPEWVTGVVNLRGRILSVLDLRRFFGLAPAETKEEDRVTPFLDLVVVETPAMEVALLAEDVLEIEPFPTSQMQSVAETIRGVSSEYVRGVIERGAEAPMVVVLDLPALLADERLIIQEEAI
ncbi:MAG: purine-binding chemotaxis protein CheW [Anaerolineae bacterium]|jgi:purine-binding chemotaxis protein CheW|nr:purine-binding chemotaxis protein CheW [Anaerolineae bacterium]